MKDVILTPGDLDIGWRTVWMEARGEPYEGKVAVAWVIRNRLEYRIGDRWNTIAQVCLDWLQFSGWRESDPNFMAAQKETLTPVAIDCIRALCEVMNGDKAHDPTHGARHYYAPAAMPKNTPVPGWAMGQTPAAKIGAHVFFNNVA